MIPGPGNPGTPDSPEDPRAGPGPAGRPADSSSRASGFDPRGPRGLVLVATLVIVGAIFLDAIPFGGPGEDAALTPSTADTNPDREIQTTGTLPLRVDADTGPPPAPVPDTTGLEDRLAALEDALARLRPGASAGEIDRLIARRLAERPPAPSEPLPGPDPLDAARDSAPGIVLDSPARDRRASGTLPGGPPAGVPARALSRDEAFLAAAADQGTARVRAAPLGDPARTLPEGTLLTATLETALDTSLPGPLRALLARDVRSWDGSAVLLPAGARLIGTYDARLSLAARRVLVAWTRAIRPDGIAVALAGTGADRLGRAGLGGDLDTRLAERFGGALLVSLITASPAAAVAALAPEGGTGDNPGAGLAADLAAEAARAAGTASRPVIDEYLRLPPVIRREPGARLTIFVTRDLVFPAPSGRTGRSEVLPEVLQ